LPAGAGENVSVETKCGALLVALLLDASHFFAQWSPRAGKLLAAIRRLSYA
jgi:hypothetical protein